MCEAKSEAREIVDLLHQRLRACLRSSIYGVYLFGSLAGEDFDPEASDIDLLVALKRELDAASFEALRELHDEFAAEHPRFRGRIDAAYLSRNALESFREKVSPIVFITPGEAFGRTLSSPGWAMNWHMLREEGIALEGPPAKAWIPEISWTEFVVAVRVQMESMPERTRATADGRFHAYAVLSGCRALYSASQLAQVSKPAAAAWTRDRHRQWSPLIRDAESIRLGTATGNEEIGARAIEFLEFVRAEIAEDAAS